ncbi:MAG TPA: DMT family transporter [Gemmatimonadales bacterium]
MSDRPQTIAVLSVAVLASAWAAPLIRLSSAPPPALAAWRVIIAVLVLAPVFFLGAGFKEWRAQPARDRRLTAAAGAALALHFATWISSVRLTSVAASIVLVDLSPIFTWVLSWWFLKERPGPRQGAGIVIAVMGAVVIASGDAGRGGGHALIGDALALTGALCGAVYFVLGRHLRARLGLVAYIAPVYGVAAALLLIWAASKGQISGPFASRDWLIFAALAVGPTLIGHSGQNYALRHLAAFAVGAAMLAEPVGSTIIAWVLPSIGERPPAATLAGGAVCLLGIALTLARGGSEPPHVPSSGF